MDDFLVLYGTPAELAEALRECNGNYEPMLMSIGPAAEPTKIAMVVRSHQSIDREQARQMRNQIAMAQRANGLIHR